jgi:hypothetical protein
MTRTRNATQRRPSKSGANGESRVERRRVLLAVAALTLVVGVGGLWAMGGERWGSSSVDAGPVHVHGLGINPADGALFIATHTGLYRSAAGGSKSVRVGDNSQDTMGFTVVGSDRFLGSGHPDLRTDLPPLLGLIESTDGGRSWKPISLLGEADFHVLRSVGRRVYGYDASNDRLLASEDTGRNWQAVERPAAILDLVVDPQDNKHLVASAGTEFAVTLYESSNSGRSWSPIGDNVGGLLAWPEAQRLVLVDDGGNVFLSSNGGRDLQHRGIVGGQPAALLATSPDDFFVALHDGTVKQSDDGGASWTIRSTP